MPLAKILQLRKPQNCRVVAYHFAVTSGRVIFSLPAATDGLFDPDEAAVKIVGLKLNPTMIRVYFEFESKQVSDLLKESIRLSNLVHRSMLAKGNVHLSEREREVLNHVLQGKPNKIIAAELYITVRTVKFHVSKLLEKYGCRSRNDLVLWYQNQREETK
jgi:DNA-binding CsgD family transcriptional regulator